MECFIESKDIIRRLRSEIEFAEGFAKFLNKKTWEKLIAESSVILDSAINNESLSSLKKAQKEIENILSPVGKAAKKYTCWCVGHGHMDMNWMWNWPETVAATNDMFVTVLKLMEEFPEFCFSQSQASVYEIIRKYNPQLFEKIKQRVAEGRWEITASEWVEGDKNLASGESLVRHMLYTRRYMAEKFGLKPEDISIAWNPDTFGHAHTIPSIYSKGGVSRYYMCRAGETRRPPVFWWVGPDGSRLLVNLEHTWYNDTIGPHNVRGLLSFCEKTGLKDWMLVYGIGDHGGGPTRRDLHLCQEMNSWPIYPNFRFATTREYYRILEKHGESLPVVNAELNYEFTGCYTSQSDIKKTNRMAECALERAEVAAVLAYAKLGMDYPHEQLRNAWTDTLFGHFHDILPGSGVKATREYHSGQFQNTVAMTGMITTNSLRAVAAEVDTSFTGDDQALKNDTHFGAGMGLGGANLGGISSACHVSGRKRAFVVFNPGAHLRTDVVTLTAWDAEKDDVHTKQFVVYDANGKKIPVQRLDAGSSWGHRYVNLAVPVTVAAMSYSSLVLEAVGDNPSPLVNTPEYPPFGERHTETGVASLSRPRYAAGYCEGTWGMENDYIRVLFDKSTGGVIELVDKTTGRNLAPLDQQTVLLEYIVERPGRMSSWLIHPTKERQCPLEMTFFEPVQFGPHLAAYEAVYKVNNSTVKVTYSLKSDSRQLEMAIDANWLEKGGPEVGIPTLRMKFPFSLKDAVGRYEIPFGSIERKPVAGQEVPSQKFVDVTGKTGDGKAAGFAVLNDSKYGYCLDESALTATLIRSSYEPDLLPEQGRFEMKFAIIPHGQQLDAGELFRAGADFNQPLQVVATDIHEGAMPASGEDMVSCSSPNVVVTGIKKAEDEDALIVRLLETSGKTGAANVRINNAFFGCPAEVHEVDLLERTVDNNAVEITKNGFNIKLPAHAIASVKMTLK